MGAEIQCHFCNGPRPSDGKKCLGCGMPVANAVRKTKPRVDGVQCPSCRRRNIRALDNHGYVCLACHAEFEKEDFSFVHYKPEVNAMKKGL
jgi:DNA-directed RNA polymerase subunit RPC12/RpoP